MALTLSPFILVVGLVVACFMEPVFLYFFQKFLNFCVQIYGLGFRFQVWVQVYSLAQRLGLVARFRG